MPALTLKCHCGAIFGTKTALKNHTTLHDHDLKCACGALLSQQSLQNHRTASPQCKNVSATPLIVKYPAPRPNHHLCGVCKKSFVAMGMRDNHLRLSHKACPTCLQVFTTINDRLNHQKVANHCYCNDHDKAFSTLKDLTTHIRGIEHTTSWECITCDRAFLSESELDDHIDDECHERVEVKAANEQQQVAKTDIQLARVEEVNLWCEECDRTLVHPEAFKNHKGSLKHTALRVALECRCGKNYIFVSALLAHLESGSCNAGMDRKKLNAIIYRYDPKRRITMAGYADRFGTSVITAPSQASLAPDDSASQLALSVQTMSLDSSRASMARSKIFTPAGSDTGDTIGLENGGVPLTYRNSEHTGTVVGVPRTISHDSSVDGRVAFTSSTGTVVGVPRSVANDDSSSEGGVKITPQSSTIGKPTDDTSSDGVTKYSPTSSMVDYTTNDPLGGGNDDFTPSSSMIARAAGEWEFLIEDHTPSTTISSNDASSESTIRRHQSTAPWTCQYCPAAFPTRISLRQHEESAAHASKIFHCPTSVSEAKVPDREFSTISGLVQHVEGGKCEGGTKALQAVAKVLERPMQKKLGVSIRIREEDDGI